MTATEPDWLKQRGGELKPGIQANLWHVMVAGTPHYKLVITPARGKYTCAVMQAVNGKRLDKGVEYPSADAALQGGLEELRQTLGW